MYVRTLNFDSLRASPRRLQDIQEIGKAVESIQIQLVTRDDQGSESELTDRNFTWRIDRADHNSILFEIVFADPASISRGCCERDTARILFFNTDLICQDKDDLSYNRRLSDPETSTRALVSVELPP